MSVTQSAVSGLIATSDDYEELNSVSLFTIKKKKKRPLMNPGRKDTFSLLEINKMKASSLTTDTSGDYQNPTTFSASKPNHQKDKAKAIDLCTVGEQDEESGERQSLIPAENQFYAAKNTPADN
jgi:hypothetical protein